MVFVSHFLLTSVVLGILKAASAFSTHFKSRVLTQMLVSTTSAS